MAADGGGSPVKFSGAKLEEIVVTVLPVSGAPGNGNQCLQDAMKTALRGRGVHVSDAPVPNAYTVQGKAGITTKDAAWKHLSIRWEVRKPSEPEFKKSIGTDLELVASTIETEICDKALSVASNSAYDVLRAGGVILPDDVQRGLDAPYDPRIRAETQALFKAIWKDTRPPARCELDIKWLDYAIPESSASKWLGVRTPADLQYSEATKYTFQDVVDPNESYGDAFCGDMDFLGYKRNLDKIPLEKGSNAVSAGPTGLRGVYRREYSFPIFNENYTRAVLIAEEGFYDVNEYHGFEVGTGASLYVKHNGVWEKRDDEAFSHGEGVNP